jgi:thiosulfate dehydrogenase [quinone] large subunit
MGLGGNSNGGAVTDRKLAYLFLRATVGINILMHGAARIASGLEPFVSGLESNFRSTPLPPFLVAGFAWALPWAEAVTGLLILLGLWNRVALSAGALMILILTFGTTLRQDWQTAGLQLLYAFIYATLLALNQYNAFSLDALLKSGSANKDRL